MSGANSAVSVFHFTSRISNAKIRKYKMATERGMGPASGTVPAVANGRTTNSEQPAGNRGSPMPPTPATESPPVLPPPAKKPRLKLNVRDQDSNKTAGDTIRVSSRPKRKPSTFRYAGEMVMGEDEPEPVAKKVKTKSKTKQSPAPSIGLSSLSSAPPSEREESPFVDPPVLPNRNDYGDFMSFYVAGGDEEDIAEVEKKSKAKPKTKSRAKSSSKPESETPKQQETTPVQPPTKTLEQPPQPQQVPPPQPAHQQPAPVVQQVLPPPPQQRPPPPQQHPGPHHVPPPFPPGAPMHRMPPPRTLPQPTIHFQDVIFDPKPTRPDTVADMVRKLEALSSALTNFGGVPAIPPTPIQQKAKPVPKGPPKPVSKPAKESATEVDRLLVHFTDGDEDESSEDDGARSDYLQHPLVHVDGPLSYGIEFIQNALKSWAQQRMTHQVTQQWQAQQQQQILQQQVQAQRRGPGRPRRYEEQNLLYGPGPIIHMDLAQTPEGVAIKDFQSILDSGCLQVNAILPAELSRALRHLYMQIDHLINQGSKSNDHWTCMSYQAQINANKERVDRFKEQQKQAREEVIRQQQLSNQDMMTKLNMRPQESTSPTDEQAHARELERRRSKQHAQAQPYISQQHLNPLQLGPRASETPTANGPSPPPGRGAAAPPQSGPYAVATPVAGLSSAGSPPLSNTARAELDGDPDDPNSKAHQVHLDKMKLYMPGFLPRSGQSMKFSFAPHSDAALRVFGSESFPTDEPDSSMPNRGPMSAPPGSITGPSGAPSEQALKGLGGDAASPIQIDSDTPAEQAYGTDEVNVKVISNAESKTTPAVSTGGFNAINAPAARPSSLPANAAPAESPDTIVVAMRHPSGTLSASASPAISKTTGVPRVTNFPV